MAHRWYLSPHRHLRWLNDKRARTAVFVFKCFGKYCFSNENKVLANTCWSGYCAATSSTSGGGGSTSWFVYPHTNQWFLFHSIFFVDPPVVILIFGKYYCSLLTLCIFFCCCCRRCCCCCRWMHFLSCRWLKLEMAMRTYRLFVFIVCVHSRAYARILNIYFRHKSILRACTECVCVCVCVPAVSRVWLSTKSQSKNKHSRREYTHKWK